MNNPRMTPKERNLVKGAIRRVFARSELRLRLINASIVKHSDPKRKRVKNWCKCPECKQFIPRSYMQVDHVSPIIGITEVLEDLTWDQVVNRLWSVESNLKAICRDCHKLKTKAENKLRRLKKRKSNG